MTTAERAELLRLLAALCDGQATDAEHARLEAILAASAQARQTYLEYVDLHARLVTHPGLSKGRKMPPKEAWAWAALEEAAGMERRAAAWNARRRGGWTWQRLATYAGVAAATLAATLLLQFALHRPEPEPLAVVPTSGPYAEPPHYVATLAQTSDAVWDADHAAIAAGSRLLPGPLRLEQGLARIRFDSGVDLLVEAPADLRLESNKAAALLAGKIVFQAEGAAAPFILTTPSSILVDTGTEYGVEVGQQREEVHVFSGEVQREAIKKAPGRALELVPAGEARWYVSTSRSGTELAIAPNRFVRELPTAPPAPPDPSAGLLAYDGFAYAQPDDFVQGRGTGGSGWNGRWERIWAAPFPKGTPQWSLNVEQGLVWPDAPTASAGGCYEYAGSVRYLRMLATPLRLDQDGVYYLSFLVRRQGPARHPRNHVGIHFRDDAEVRRARPLPDWDKRLTICIEKANLLFAKLERICPNTPLPLSYNETYLLVAKIVASAANPDQVLVRVYGIEEQVDATEPANWSLPGKEANSNRSFEWLEIEIDSFRRQSLDELRFGRTWSSVTGPYVAPPNP
jgi:hypothetical protein